MPAKRIVILGAGPAGLSAASFFVSKGHEVHVFDRGKIEEKFFSATGSFEDVDFRAGGLGGSTSFWGGQLVRVNFQDIDNWLKFETISAKQIEVLENHTDCILEELGIEIPRGNNFQCHHSIDYTSNCKDIKKPKMTGSRILNEKNLVEIYAHTINNPLFKYFEGVSGVKFTLDSSEKVLLMSSGELIRMESSIVILACGTIENTALLIRSSEAIQELCHQNLGKYLQDHPHGNALRIEKFGGPFNSRRKLLKKCELHEKLKAEFCYKDSNDFYRSAVVEFHPFSYQRSFAKEIASTLSQFDMQAIVETLRRFAKTSLSKILGKEFIIPFADIWVQYEQSRNPCSKIIFEGKVQYSWMLHQEDLDFVNGLISDVEKWLSNLGFEVSRQRRFNNVYELSEWSSEACHPSGTIPIGRDSESGVANFSGKIYAIPNAYVVGAALFPTSGWFNPTLLIMAHSRMVAESICQKID
jgi:hypothetical protein